MKSNTNALVDFTTPHRFIDVGHSKLAHWSTGSGPDLIFIHGWPLHSATYRNIIPIVAQHFTCHCIDLPGAGQTVYGSQTDFSFSAHAQTLISAIKQLGLKHYGLVAHDSGGVVTRYLAAQETKAVFGMVLGNTEIPNYQSPLLRLLVTVGKTPGGMALITNALRIKALRHSLIGFGSGFNETSLIDGEFFDLFVEPLYKSNSVRLGQTQLLKYFNVEEINQLKLVHSKIEAPTLLQWGEDDPYFSIQQAREMMPQFLGGASMEVYEAGKLFIHEEYPERFADHTTNFFQKCLLDQRIIKEAS